MERHNQHPLSDLSARKQAILESLKDNSVINQAPRQDRIWTFEAQSNHIQSNLEILQQNSARVVALVNTFRDKEGSIRAEHSKLVWAHLDIGNGEPCIAAMEASVRCAKNIQRETNFPDIPPPKPDYELGVFEIDQFIYDENGIYAILSGTRDGESQKYAAIDVTLPTDFEKIVILFDPQTGECS